MRAQKPLEAEQASTQSRMGFESLSRLRAIVGCRAFSGRSKMRQEINQFPVCAVIAAARSLGLLRDPHQTNFRAEFRHFFWPFLWVT